MVKINVIKSKFMRGVFDQNTYVLTTKSQAIIIDAGANVEDIKEIVGNRKVQGVLMTHLHFDHFWFLEEYLNEFDTAVFVMKGAEQKFVDYELNGSLLIRQKIEKNIDKTKIKYYENQLSLGDFRCEIFETAGHSADSVCIKIAENLFTGDTIFVDSIGRTDLKDSSNSQMIESLEKIKNINFTIAYPGHYESATKNQIIRTIEFYL